MILLAMYAIGAFAQATDITNMTDAIYVQKAKAKPGEQFRLSVCMKNQTVIVGGFQFDLYLPNGITFVKNEDGYYIANLSTSRTTEKQMNYFDCDIQQDGAQSVVCSSTKGATFSGTDGEVCTIMVEVDKKLDPQDCLLQLKNVVVTYPNAKRYIWENTTSVLSVIDYDCGIKGDMNGDGKVNVSDIMIIVNIILNQ